MALANIPRHCEILLVIRDDRGIEMGANIGVDGVIFEQILKDL